MLLLKFGSQGILIPAGLRCGAASMQAMQKSPFLPCSLVWALSKGKSLDSSSWTFRSSALCSQEANLSQEIQEQGCSGVHWCLLLQCVICLLPTARFALICWDDEHEIRENFPLPFWRSCFSWDSGLESCSSSELQACDLLSLWAHALAHQENKEKEIKWKKSQIRGNWQVDGNLKYVGLCLCPVSCETPALSSTQHA